MIAATKISTAYDELRGMLDRARAPVLRTMREFAEQEIVIPSGPYRDLRFRTDRQPFMGHWFAAVESNQWTEFVLLGPSQSGKTLCGFVIPILYHLFELRETVIAAVPDDEMVRDKWDQDLEPVIRRTKYRDLLPKRGSGSRGGSKIEAVDFLNGATLRFMTAGGSDKARAGYTARVVCMTETDGFDIRTTTSAEANKIEQIEARTRAFPVSQRRIYKECTVSTALGHTWTRYHTGTASRIVLPCPHCLKWVTLEREDFRGWQEAETDAAAMESSCFYCAACGQAWTEDDRRAANHVSRLLHAGEEIGPDGEVSGQAPRTRTLGFRWSTVNNLLVPASDVGRDEWRAARAVDEQDEERKLCQFVWATPYDPASDEKVDIDVAKLQRRSSGLGKGQKPAGCKLVTIGVDVNKPVLHWTAIAWDDQDRGYILDYGTQGVRVKEYVFADAIRVALESLQTKLGVGWSEPMWHRAGVDCRWETDAVVAAVRALKDSRWRCMMGHGEGHWSRKRQTPNRVAGKTIAAGEHWHETIEPKYPTQFLWSNANHWKTWLHNRLVLDIPEDGEIPAGAITLYDTAADNPHFLFCRHLTAEREIYKFDVAKRGHVKVWEPVRSENHWLDATYMACVLRARYWKKKQATASGGTASPSGISIVGADQARGNFNLGRTIRLER